MYNLRYLRHMRTRKMINPIYFYSASRSYYEFNTFADSVIVVDGKEYSTAEHYYQSQKFVHLEPAYAEEIRLAPSPRLAKKLGRDKEHKIPLDWDVQRMKVMEKALYEKFTQHQNLKEKLLNTGDRTLILNTPIDFFWGTGKTKTGYNMLGHLLMNLRDDLREANYREQIKNAMSR